MLYVSTIYDIDTTISVLIKLIQIFGHGLTECLDKLSRVENNDKWYNSEFQTMISTT